MAKVVLYHNPKCSKSRGALELLQGAADELEVVEYLESPLSRGELEILLAQLGDSPGGLVRKDKHFAELGLDPGDYASVGAVAEVLAEHPRLMERPVAVSGGRAVIGRPPERVLELLDGSSPAS